MLMLWVTSLFISFLGFVCEWHNKKKKSVMTFFAIAVTVFNLIILMTANETGYDATAYIRFYNWIKAYGNNPYDYTYEMFYRIIMWNLRFFPYFTYQQFHALLLFVSGGILIGFFLKEYSLSIFGVFFIYLLSGTFAGDGMQSKNFLAVTIMICALVYLFRENKRSIIIYYILLFCAMLFHFSFVVYTVLPIIRLPRVRQSCSMIPFIGGALYMFFLAEGRMLTGELLNDISQIYFLKKISSYTHAYSGLRSLYPFMIYYILLGILVCFKKTKVVSDEKTQKFLQHTLEVWRIMGIFLPFLTYANAAYRLFRNLYILIFTAYANGIVSIKDGSIKRIQYSVMVIGVSLFIFYYVIALGQHIHIYKPILEGYPFWVNSV